jgi:hypothetical protein
VALAWPSEAQCQWVRSAHADELVQLQQQLAEAQASADQSHAALQVGLGCSGSV